MGSSKIFKTLEEYISNILPIKFEIEKNDFNKSNIIYINKLLRIL